MAAIKRVDLDVRPVEPKHRFERATRGEEAFGFEYLEAGPERWCVDVTKKSPGRP